MFDDVQTLSKLQNREPSEVSAKLLTFPIPPCSLGQMTVMSAPGLRLEVQQEPLALPQIRYGKLPPIPQGLIGTNQSSHS